MTYTDLDGYLQVGEIWSAGPLANTVWVLTETKPVVVSTRTRKQVAYEWPRFGPSPGRKRLEWAYEVIATRYLNPLPEGFIDCDPEHENASAIWNHAIEIERTQRQIKETRYADRASVSAKRLLELDKK